MAEEGRSREKSHSGEKCTEEQLDKRRVLMYIADVQASISPERYTGAEREKHDYACQVLEGVFRAISNMTSFHPQLVHCRYCEFYRMDEGDEEDGLGYCSFHSIKFARTKAFCYWGRKREGAEKEEDEGAGKEEAGEEE